MYLDTIYQLDMNNEIVVKEGEFIKVFLENGEILIGEYSSSDYTELCIGRNGDDIWIVFEEINNIEIIKVAE